MTSRTRLFRLQAILLLGVLALMSAPGYAEVRCNHPPARVSAGATPVESLHQHLLAASSEWWAASPEQIRNAPCRPPLPTQAEMDLFVHEWGQAPGDEVRTETVHGIRFENESPRLLELFRTLTTPRDSFGRPLTGPSGTPPVFRSSCRIVRCALAELIGIPEATRTLYLYARFGANSSPVGVEGTQRFTTAELDDVIRGLSDFPPRALPRNEPFPINRVQDGRGRPGTLANAVMMLFEAWSDHSREERQGTLFHEMAHRLGHELDRSPEWLRISGWTLRPQAAGTSIFRDYTLTDPGRAVSEYGSTNPAEDFAESAVAYRYNPRELARRSPEKYRFMKEVVFQGLEYTSASGCAPGNAYANRIDQTIEDHPEAHGTPPGAILNSAIGSCTTALLSALPATGPLGQPMPAQARECLGGAVLNRTRSELFDQTIASSLRYPDEARRALQEAGETLGHPYSGHQRLVAVAAAERAARSELRRTLLEAFLSGGRFELFASVRPNETPEAFCASRTNYAYQWLDEVPTTALRNPGDSLAYYRARDPIQAFTHSLCVQLQSTSPTRRGFTREELERAIRQRIPD